MSEAKSLQTLRIGMAKCIEFIFFVFIVSVFLVGVFVYKNISLFQILFIPILAFLIIISFKDLMLKGFVLKSTDFALILLFGLSLGSYFWSLDKIGALEETVKFSFAVLIFFVTQLFILILSKYKDIKNLVMKMNKTIFIIGLILALSVIADAFSQINFSSFVGWKGEYRSVGLLGRPNFGAGVLNICLAFLVPIASKKKVKGMILFMISILIYTTALFLIGSRMGIILYGVNILLFTFNLRRIKIKMSKIISYFLLLILAGVIIIFFLQNYAKNLYVFESFGRLITFSQGEDVTVNRLDLLNLSNQLLRENAYIWIYGVGPGNFKEFTKIYLGYYQATHNLYLELLIGLGLGGLLLFLYLQVKFVAYSKKLLKNSEKFIESSTVLPYYSVLFVIYIEYLFLTDLRVNKVIWVIYGIICAMIKYFEKHYENDKQQLSL